MANYGDSAAKPDVAVSEQIDTQRLREAACEVAANHRASDAVIATIQGLSDEDVLDLVSWDDVVEVMNMMLHSIYHQTAYRMAGHTMRQAGEEFI